MVRYKLAVFYVQKMGSLIVVNPDRFSRKSGLNKHQSRYHSEELIADALTNHPVPPACYDDLPVSRSIIASSNTAQPEYFSDDRSSVQPPMPEDTLSFRTDNFAYTNEPEGPTQLTHTGSNLPGNAVFDPLSQTFVQGEFHNPHGHRNPEDFS